MVHSVEHSVEHLMGHSTECSNGAFDGAFGGAFGGAYDGHSMEHSMVHSTEHLVGHSVEHSTEPFDRRIPGSQHERDGSCHSIDAIFHRLSLHCRRAPIPPVHREHLESRRQVRAAVEAQGARREGERREV